MWQLVKPLPSTLQASVCLCVCVLWGQSDPVQTAAASYHTHCGPILCEKGWQLLKHATFLYGYLCGCEPD